MCCDKCLTNSTSVRPLFVAYLSISLTVSLSLHLSIAEWRGPGQSSSSTRPPHQQVRYTAVPSSYPLPLLHIHPAAAASTSYMTIHYYSPLSSHPPAASLLSILSSSRRCQRAGLHREEHQGAHRHIQAAGRRHAVRLVCSQISYK
jgi:hypothetical protein